MRFVYAILFGLLFSSCGPISKLRRAERLIKKAELQGATWKSDTVFKEIPIVIPEIRRDTIFNYRYLRDTIVVNQSGIITKIKVDTVNQKVYVSTKCPEQTVTAKAPVIVHRTIEAESWLKWWFLLIAYCLGYITRIITKLFSLWKGIPFF